MRKFIEEMSISVTEKDAEIIKLKMHLGDERHKQNQRTKIQENQISVPEHDYQELLEENEQLRNQMSDLKNSHKQEVRRLKDILKNSHSGTELHSKEQEETIIGLREECFRM